uniref:Uncharacterized protein n=1 Tax=Anguilla anguilla TaxID=7936 RepID=A0A0E9UCR0_ANGAN
MTPLTEQAGAKPGCFFSTCKYQGYQTYVIKFSIITVFNSKCKEKFY